MRKRRGRTRTVRYRRGVNRPGGTPETTREAGWLSCSGLGLPDQPAPPSHDPSRWSVCEVHDPTGEPGAGNPHAGFGERGTGNAAMGAGLRPGAKATDKPPDPKTGAPAHDSTRIVLVPLAAASVIKVRLELRSDYYTCRRFSNMSQNLSTVPGAAA